MTGFELNGKNKLIRDEVQNINTSKSNTLQYAKIKFSNNEKHLQRHKR